MRSRDDSTTADGGNWTSSISRIAALLGLLAGGCTHIGPTTVVEQRLPYHEAVSESWKQQMLSNIVKMRYSDTITFSEVSQIVNSRESSKSGGVDIGFNPGVSPGLSAYDRFRALFQSGLSQSDRPTITYSPRTGSDFLRQLAKPLSPASILLFVESEYPADVVLQLTIESINGVHNRSSSGTQCRAADPEFEWVLQVLRRAQLSRSMSMRVKVDTKQKQATVLRLRSPMAPTDLQLEEELNAVKQLLNLDPAVEEYSVVLGTVQSANDEIVMQTRPYMRILQSLSQYVQVPEKHVLDGSARPIDLSGVTRQPLSVFCSALPPDCCFVAVPYRGCWFWIDDRDLVSKRTFTYLMLLLAQVERDHKLQLPLVTIPVESS